MGGYGGLGRGRGDGETVVTMAMPNCGLQALCEAWVRWIDTMYVCMYYGTCFGTERLE